MVNCLICEIFFSCFLQLLDVHFTQTYTWSFAFLVLLAVSAMRGKTYLQVQGSMGAKRE